MRLRSRVIGPVVAIVAAALAGTPPAAGAAPVWLPCSPTGFECTRVPVPLDRAGTVKGEVHLNVARRRAASNPADEAVLALAGGPGQAAVPIAAQFRADLAPGLTTRDLLVIDQRGTGRSDPLHCNGLYTAGSVTAGVRSCARELGTARAFYRTSDSVADIEAVRAAAGYAKLVIYGVSYGTKVAEAYAAAHPDRVAGLVLDSVVTPGGPDALQRSSFAATGRVLGELCSQQACAGITGDLLGDVRTLAARLVGRPLQGPVFDGRGRRYTARIGESGLWNVLLAGDLNPTLRAELPGSVQAALHGDPGPLLRLSARAEGLNNLARPFRRPAAHGDAGRQLDSVADDDAVFVATTCEENRTIPWTRGASETQRAAEVRGAARALPAVQTDPFDYRPSLTQMPRICLGYPVAAPLDPDPGALPAVPTLVLDGGADLRTPVEDAQSVANAIPGAHLVVVPHTGHSVLGSDQGTCAAHAITAFFAGQAPAACPSTGNPFAPTPRPPLRLRTSLSRAAHLTLDDARRQIIGETIENDVVPRRVGGLRGGYLTVAGRGRYTLVDYEYVRGMRVSGRVAAGTVAHLHVTLVGNGQRPRRRDVAVSATAR